MRAMPPPSDAPEERASDRPAAGDAAEDADLWPRVKELLADCLDVEPAARGPLLAAADARVRSRVEALLAASARAPAGLDDPGLGFAGEDPPDDDSCVRL